MDNINPILFDCQHPDFRKAILDLILNNQVDALQHLIETAQEQWTNEPITTEMRNGIFPITSMLENKFHYFMYYIFSHYSNYYQWGTGPSHIPNEAEDYLYHLRCDSPSIVYFQRLGLNFYAQNQQIEEFKELFPLYYSTYYFNDNNHEEQLRYYTELLEELIQGGYKDIYQICLNPQQIRSMFSSHADIKAIHCDSLISHMGSANNYFLRNYPLFSEALFTIEYIYEDASFSSYRSLFHSIEYWTDVIIPGIKDIILNDDLDKFDYLLNHSCFSSSFKNDRLTGGFTQFFKLALESYGTTILEYLITHESFKQEPSHLSLINFNSSRNQDFAHNIIAKQNLHHHLTDSLSQSSLSHQVKI